VDKLIIDEGLAKDDFSRLEKHGMEIILV
jgi:hypothetical protein